MLKPGMSVPLFNGGSNVRHYRTVSDDGYHRIGSIRKKKI